MTELLNQHSYEENLAGLSKRELYEGQSAEYLRAQKQRLLGKMSLLESEVHLINDVLDGVHGEHENSEWIG